MDESISPIRVMVNESANSGGSLYIETVALKCPDQLSDWCIAQQVD